MIQNDTKRDKMRQPKQLCILMLYIFFIKNYSFFEKNKFKIICNIILYNELCVFQKFIKMRKNENF